MEEVSEEEETLEPIPGHPTWSSSISMGLVNIPVRAVPIILERKISLRMLHQKCKTPISHRLFCEEGESMIEKKSGLIAKFVLLLISLAALITCAIAQENGSDYSSNQVDYWYNKGLILAGAGSDDEAYEDSYLHGLQIGISKFDT